MSGWRRPWSDGSSPRLAGCRDVTPTDDDGNARMLRPHARTFKPLSRRTGAFTLLETALATVIVGVGVLALVEAQTAFIRSNSWSSHSATATYLANEVRELTRRLPKFDPVNGLFVNGSGSSATVVGWGPSTGAVTVDDFTHITAFDGMRFSSTGTAGFTDGDLPGPIDAFGALIPQINDDGSIQRDTNGNPVPMNGWTQVISVQKVDPFNASVTYAKDATIAANTGTGFKGLAINEFPIRVTVQVTFRGPFDSQESTVATVSWLVP